MSNIDIPACWNISGTPVVRRLPKRPLQRYIWAANEAKQDEKVTMRLYQQLPEKPPRLVFNKVLTRVPVNETTHGLIDEVTKKLIVVSTSKKGCLIVMKFGLKWEIDGTLQVELTPENYKSLIPTSHHGSWLSRFVLSPANGRLVRFSQFGDGYFVLDWFALDKKGDKRNVWMISSCTPGQSRSELTDPYNTNSLQFCNRGKTLVAFLAPSVKKKAQGSIGPATYPTTAVFSLNYAKPYDILLVQIFDQRIVSPRVEMCWKKQNEQCLPILHPIGRCYKYWLFYYTAENSNRTKNVLIFAVRNLHKAVFSHKSDKKPLKIERIHVSLPFLGQTFLQTSLNALEELSPKAIGGTCTPTVLINRPSMLDNRTLATFVREVHSSKKFTADVYYDIATEHCYNDYRKCAGCERTEKRKRRNSEGKRTASFKVCRDCKKRNFHWQWFKYPCHFCSEKCMKNNWKRHKKQHKLPQLATKCADHITAHDYNYNEGRFPWGPYKSYEEVKGEMEGMAKLEMLEHKIKGEHTIGSLKSIAHDGNMASLMTGKIQSINKRSKDYW